MHPRSVAGVRLIVAMWGLAVLSTILLVTLANQRTALLFAGVIVTAMVATMIGALMVRSGRLKLRRDLQRHRYLLCPACHYSLEAVFEEPMTRCRCPECGQEWEKGAVLRAWGSYR